MVRKTEKGGKFRKGAEPAYGESEGEKGQCADVCAGCVIHFEIYFLIRRKKRFVFGSLF